MKHWYQPPNAALSACIRTTLVLEGFSSPEDRALPLFTNGMPALYCRMEKEPDGLERIAQLALMGRSIPDDHWQIGSSTTVIVYFFQPFALPCLFNIAAAQLTEQPFDLHGWKPHKVNALRTRMAYAATTAAKTEALDDLLLLQLREQGQVCESIRYATDRIMEHPDNETLSGLPAELALHKRTFQRMFRKYVGITAGQFRRICQFQQSFTQLKAGRFNDLADVAYDNGFADPSHFIRSFKEFAQTTPYSYLRFGLQAKPE